MGTLVVASCPQHHGLFITNGALRNAREASPTEIEALDESLIPPPPSEDDPLKCPTCSEDMMRRRLGKVKPVTVDTCRTHGTWFDAGELKTVLVDQGVADKARAVLDVSLALEASRDEETARQAIDLTEDLLDTFNVFVLGRKSLRRR